MDNQHRKISGYRELSAAEIDLMNRIKAKGQELLDLQQELNLYLVDQQETAMIQVVQYERHRLHNAEPLRWDAIGKTNIQTGVMALVRAVAQPEGV